MGQDTEHIQEKKPVKERIHKWMSAQGICSRRKAEEYIRQGRVLINGVPAQIADAVCGSEEILLDGKPLKKTSGAHIYIMLNKPRGYVVTLADERGRKQVSDLVADIPARIYPAGRLDMYSEGLLIMSNDGELTHKLTHPSHEVYKQYLITITAREDREAEPQKELAGRFVLDGVELQPAKCTLLGRDGSRYKLLISIREGKNRQIRRMCEISGYTVNQLRRVAIGKLRLGDLPVGKYRHLSDAEVAYLKNL